MFSKALQIRSCFPLISSAFFFVAFPAIALEAAPDRESAGQEVQPSPQQEFQALLARVKKSDSTVDFGRMRQLQTQLDSYDPYDSNVEDHPFTALDQGDVRRAKALAEAILAENYLQLEAHLAAAAVAEKSGDAAAAAHHRYVVQGVLDSILRSGDGKTPGTAFQVVAISEEYAVMRHLGLRVAEQLLIHSEGHSFDLLRGIDPRRHTRQEVFFNIDPIMAALAKKFSE